MSPLIIYMTSSLGSRWNSLRSSRPRATKATLSGACHRTVLGRPEPRMLDITCPRSTAFSSSMWAPRCWFGSRVASSIGDAEQGIGHGLLEGLGPAPLLRRAALAVGADLVHRRVQLDVEAIGILELDARIAAGAAPAFVDDRHALRPEKVADLEQLRDGGHLEGAVMEAGLSLARHRVRRFGRHQRDGVMVGRVAEKDHTPLVAVGDVESHDLRPEPRGPLDVGHREHDVTELLHLHGRRVVGHRCPPQADRVDYLGPTPRSASTGILSPVAGILPRCAFVGTARRVASGPFRYVEGGITCERLPTHCDA